MYIALAILALCFPLGRSIIIEDGEGMILNYLSTPEREWDRRLGESIPMQGNGAVLAKGDDSLVLYVTSSDGRLSIIDAASGQVSQTIRPLPDEPIRSQSTVAIGNTYVVYAIIVDKVNSVDTNSTEQGTSITNVAAVDMSLPVTQVSRLVVVNRTTMKMEWISDPLDGVLAGSPVISSDSRHIFFTRNAPTSAYFTILESQNGTILLDEPSTNITVLNNHIYGPVSIAQNVSTTPYYTGEVGNTNDIIVWHSGGGGVGNTSQGETQLFQFPISYNGTTSTGADVLQQATHQVGSRTWIVAAAPLVSDSASNLYFGTSEGDILGWENRTLELPPKFILPLRSDDAPTWLTLYEDRFYVVTSESYFYAINKTTRAVLWEFSNQRNASEVSSSGASIVANPVLSEDGKQIYIAKGNRLYSKDALTGKDLWNDPISTRNGGSNITANFCVSGMYLYYIGHEPNIISSLRIARPVTPTTSPSRVPSQRPIVAAPMVPKPTTLSSTKADPNNALSRNAKTAIIVIGIGIVVIVIIGGIVYYVRKQYLGNDGIDTDYNPSVSQQQPPRQPHPQQKHRHPQQQHRYPQQQQQQQQHPARHRPMEEPRFRPVPTNYKHPSVAQHHQQQQQPAIQKPIRYKYDPSKV